jgi:hypothetical protein
MERRLVPPRPQQLPLHDRPAEWRLDERTRARGLRGVTEARAAVLRARQRVAA